MVFVFPGKDRIAIFKDFQKERIASLRIPEKERFSCRGFSKMFDHADEDFKERVSSELADSGTS